MLIEYKKNREEIMALSNILDKNLQTIISDLGYTSLYPIQKQAISKGLLKGKNLLVTSPTASGKTLIAIIAAIKSIEKKQKVIYLTPLRSLATEKYNDFLALKNVYFNGNTNNSLNSDQIIENNISKKSIKDVKKELVIKIASGDYDSKGKDLLDADIVILTNEKLDALIRNDTELLSNVGLFVVDEIHLIGDKDRGPTLEIMLTKIKKFYHEAQILALSATVSNSKEIAEWLHCTLLESNWRPTTLIEGIYDQGIIRTNNNKKSKINHNSSISSAPVDIAVDSVENGGQVIIFADTRKRAASLAAKSAEGIFSLLDKKQKEKAANLASKLAKISDDTELTKNLVTLISKGVGFHHAGLGHVVREKIEEYFKNGTIKLLASTPTLAAGVNLPARRVILSSILRYDYDYGSNVPISILEYKQLCGRAGRPQYDTFGEAIIVSESGMNSEDLYDHYILGTPEPIKSKLFNEKSLRFHILSTISTIPGIKKTELYELFSDTLFAQNTKKSNIIFKLDSVLEYLEEYEFIKCKNDRYIATAFGKQTSILYIDPLSAVEFKNTLNSISEIKKSLDSGQYENITVCFLHLISECSDFYPKLALRKKDMDIFYTTIRKYSNDLIYDLDENNCSRSFLGLCEWINETSDRSLSDKLAIDPGDMHRISESGEWLIHSLYEFAKLLKREDLLPIISELRTRIKYGIKKELLSLVKIEGIGRIRARALHDSGIVNITILKSTPEFTLSKISKIGPTVAKKIKKQFN